MPPDEEDAKDDMDELSETESEPESEASSESAEKSHAVLRQPQPKQWLDSESEVRSRDSHVMHKVLWITLVCEAAIQIFLQSQIKTYKYHMYMHYPDWFLCSQA